MVIISMTMAMLLMMMVYDDGGKMMYDYDGDDVT